MFGKRTCLGADINGEEIRVVELRKNGTKYEILQAARISLVDGSPSSIAAALSGFLADTGTSAGNIVCGLASKMCSIKLSHVPPAKPADLAKIVRFEAESQIPLPLSEVIWGFTAEPSASDQELHVTIASAGRSAVEELSAALGAVGVSPSAFMVSSLAAVRSTAHAGAWDGPVMLAGIGGQWTDLCIVDEGRVRGAHSVKLGGDDLTEAIMHDRKVSVEEAERIKRDQGVDLRVRLVMEGTEASPSRVEDWIETAAAEMRRAAVALTVKSPAEWPTKVVLVGASSGVPELAAALGQRVGIPVVQADPWAAMGICEICAMTTTDPPSAFAAATGLAKAGLDGLPSINLKPSQAAQGRSVERKERALMVSLGATAVVLLAVLLARAPGAEERSRQLSALTKQTKQMQAQIRRTGPDRRAEARVVKGVVADIERNGYGCLDLLQQASESLPRSVWLSDLSYQAENSVVLKGRALSNSAVADAVDALVFLGLFDSVNMDYSNLATDAGNQTYDFQITCALPGSKSKSRKTGNSAGGQRTGSRTGIVVR